MKSKHEEGTFVKNEAILWKTIGLGFICHTPANLYGRPRKLKIPFKGPGFVIQ